MTRDVPDQLCCDGTEHGNGDGPRSVPGASAILKDTLKKKKKGITWYYSFDDVVNLFTLVRLSVVMDI